MPTATAQHLTADRLTHVNEKWNLAEYWLALGRPVPASLAVRAARILGNAETLQPELVRRTELALAAERTRVWERLPQGPPHSALAPSRIAHKARITTADVYAHLENLTSTGHANQYGNGSRRKYTWAPGSVQARELSK